MEKIKNKNWLKKLLYLLLGISLVSIFVIPPSVVSAISFDNNKKNVDMAIKLFDQKQEIPSEKLAFQNFQVIDNIYNQRYYSANILNDKNVNEMLMNVPSTKSLFTIQQGYAKAPEDFSISISIIKDSIAPDGSSIEANIKFLSNQSLSKYAKTIQVLIGGFSTYQDYLVEVNQVMQKGSLDYLNQAQDNINFANPKLPQWISSSQLSVKITKISDKSFSIEYISNFDSKISLKDTLNY